MIIMLAEEKVKEIIRSYPIISLSPPVQKFYNGPSCAIDIEELKTVDEIILLFRSLLESN